MANHDWPERRKSSLLSFCVWISSLLGKHKTPNIMICDVTDARIKKNPIGP